MPTRPLWPVNPPPRLAVFAAAVTRFPMLRVIMPKTEAFRSSSSSAGLMACRASPAWGPM